MEGSKIYLQADQSMSKQTLKFNSFSDILESGEVDKVDLVKTVVQLQNERENLLAQLGGLRKENQEPAMIVERNKYDNLDANEDFTRQLTELKDHNRELQFAVEKLYQEQEELYSVL